MIREAFLYLAAPDDVHTARLSVAGRPLAFRIVMAAVRAGVARVAVPGPLRDPALEATIARTPSARAAVHWLDAADASAPAGPILLLPAGVLVTAAALAPLLAAPEAVALAEAPSAAPVATAPSNLLGPIWTDLAGGKPVGAAVARVLAAAGAARVGGAGLVAPVRSTAILAAEARLLATLGSPIDTRFDREFHRRLSRPVTRWAIARAVTPNAITLASIAVGLCAALAIASGAAAGALAGLALYAAAVVLDHADGEVARVAFAESAFGEWLDIGGDTLVHALVVLAMGVASTRRAGVGLGLGLIAAAGIVGSAALAKFSPPASGRVGGMLNALGNRDGFYAMLLIFVAVVLVAPGWLPWLMIVVAAGSHAYWLTRVVHLFHR